MGPVTIIDIIAMNYSTIDLQLTSLVKKKLGSLMI